MNRRLQRIPQTKRGSALLAALCFCAVLGIALASYIGVCFQTLQASTRTNQGTYSFELAETGMEEALGALNRSTQPAYDWSDWTLNTGVSPKTATKTLSGFSFGNGTVGSVTITIENYDGRQSGFNPTLTATGTTTPPGGIAVNRTLKATAQLAPLFVNAVATTSTSTGGNSGLRFGSAGTVDSYDSTAVPPPGETSDEQAIREWYASFSAVVSSANRIVLTNAQINGYATTATDATGTILLSYSSNARVAGPDTRASVQIDQTRLSSSPYQPVFDIKVPGTPTDIDIPGAANTTLGSSDPELPSTLYDTGDLNLTGTLTINGDVVLVVNGDFTIKGAGQIIVPAGASLQIVMPEPSDNSLSKILFIGGNGIDNRSPAKSAKKVAIFYEGRNPKQNPEIATTQAFCGVIYAPNCNSDLVVSSPSLDFKGSLVAKTINISGSPAIHFDLDLRKRATKFSAIDTPFMVSSWQEIAPTPAP